MTKTSILIVSLLLFFACHLHGQATKQGQPYAVLPHPRILLKAGEEEVIKAKLKSDVTYNFLHNVILKECDKILGAPVVERTMIGRRLLNASRELQRRVFFLSYAWRTTGVEKYRDRSVEEMLNACAFTDWNPSHFLDVAEMTMGIAVGYDWLYKDLTDSTRRTLEDAILKKGLEPSLLPQNNTWLGATHNWNQVCNASMAFGAIAIQDKQPRLATSILDRSIKSVVLAMNEYLPDGGYPEGYGYWSYGTTFNVLLISGLEKAFGSDYGLSAHPGFLKTPYYLLNMSGSSGLPFNYSDSDPKPHLNPAMFWFASQLKDPSLLASESRILDGRKNLHRVRELPMLMIWAKDINLMKIPDPKSCQWVGGGKNPVALLRNSWDPRTGIYVGLKAGTPQVTHSHMDIGSFVMDAMGERWAVDLGPQDYNSLESRGMKIWTMKQDSDRWKVFRLSNFSHNTLTFNKSLQSADGFAPIISSTSTPSFRSAITDLSSLYKNNVRRLKRGVAIVDERFVVVRDEMELSTASTIRWNMLTPAYVNIVDNNTAQLTKNGKKLLLRVTEPSNVVLTVWSSQPPSAYDDANPGTVFVGFEVPGNAGENVVFNVMLIPDSGGPQNRTTIPSLKEWSSVTSLE